MRQPPTVAAARAADNLVALCDSLLTERGEVSGARVAAEAVAAYEQLTDAGRDAFFTKLVDHFAADPAKVNLAIDNYRADPTPSAACTISTSPRSRAARNCFDG